MSRLGASMLLHGEVLPVDEVLARIEGIEGRRDGGRGELALTSRRLTAVGPFDERDFSPPGRPGRPIACRPCRGSVWSAPAAAWARRSAGPCRRRLTWSWWLPSILAVSVTTPVAAPSSARSTRSPTSAPRWWWISPSPKRCATTTRTMRIRASTPSLGRVGCPRATWPPWGRSLGERDRANLVVVPNFAIGAVLLLHLSRIAAPHMDGVEIIELHHNEKPDAPSGTAMHTATVIAAARRAAGSDPLPADPTTDVVLAGLAAARRPTACTCIRSGCPASSHTRR